MDNPVLDQITAASYLDHSVLAPTATASEVKKACQTARFYATAGCCVRPSDVAMASGILKDSTTAVVTVIGFPHGTTSSAAKLAEAGQAIADGAKELDMVINIGRFLSNDYSYVATEIAALAELAHKNDCLLKVILENCYLNPEQIKTASVLAIDAGCDYLKTSTGFGSGGATVAAVKLMRSAVTRAVGIKAAGGIRTLKQMQDLLAAGATRIGTSSTAAIMAELTANK